MFSYVSQLIYSEPGGKTLSFFLEKYSGVLVILSSSKKQQHTHDVLMFDAQFYKAVIAQLARNMLFDTVGYVYATCHFYNFIHINDLFYKEFANQLRNKFHRSGQMIVHALYKGNFISCSHLSQKVDFSNFIDFCLQVITH